MIGILLDLCPDLTILECTEIDPLAELLLVPPSPLWVSGAVYTEVKLVDAHLDKLEGKFEFKITSRENGVVVIKIPGRMYFNEAHVSHLSRHSEWVNWGCPICQSSFRAMDWRERNEKSQPEITNKK